MFVLFGDILKGGDGWTDGNNVQKTVDQLVCTIFMSVRYFNILNILVYCRRGSIENFLVDMKILKKLYKHFHFIIVRNEKTISTQE